MTTLSSPDLPQAARGGARLDALDNLRGILMWLGIVLHVTVIYAYQPPPMLVWHDEQRSVFADLMMTSIHAFRMPAFFILAGFFAALLAHSRGPAGLLRHRFVRIALPFALFWPFVGLATGLAAVVFLNRMMLGQWGLDGSVLRGLPIPKGPGTIHLWFLWMLLWYSIATALLMYLPRAWFRPIAAALASLARQPWGFAVLSLPLLIAGASYERGFIIASGAFLPPWNEWLHNGMFFAFGLMLHGRQSELFVQFQRRALVCAGIGLAFYIATGAIILMRGPELLSAYSYHCAGWLWSFAAIGAALRFLPSRHVALSYLADSAYFVYLVHFPLTIIFGAVLFNLPLPALLKIVINISFTTFVCLGSYQLLVRYSWIGKLLSGKRRMRPRAYAI